MRPADARVGQVRAPAPSVAAPELEEAPAMPDDGAPVFADDAILPCKDDADRTAARQAFDTVSNEIMRLDDGAKKEATLDQLKALLKTKCFELAAADLADPLEFDSSMSLKHWWFEGRASQALYEYLQPSIYSVTTAEEPRPTMLLEGHEQSPLAPLLCKAKDYDCGKPTMGWMRRTDWKLSHPDTQAPDPKDPCVEQIAQATPEERWTVFRSCRESMVQRYPVLPLGRFKAPTDGLFIRVDPSRCHSTTIYDLATGARLSAGLCSTTNGKITVHVGRVPVASLREAAWLTMIAGAAKNDYRPSSDAAVPEGVVPGRPRDDAGGESIGMGTYGTSSRRTMWSWYRKNSHGQYVGQISGEQFRGPSYEAAAYAAELFDLADEGFEDTCAPPLPLDAIRSVVWGSPGPTAYESTSDIAATIGHSDSAIVQTAIITAKTPPKCTTAL